MFGRGQKRGSMYAARSIMVPPPRANSRIQTPSAVVNLPQPARVSYSDEFDQDMEIVRPKKSRKDRLPGFKLLKQLARQREIEELNKQIDDMKFSE